jgi:hypothetical protein
MVSFKLQQMRHPLITQTSLVFSALVFSTQAFAMSLGVPQTQSVLGENLRISIPVKLKDGESLQSNCFKLPRRITQANGDTPVAAAVRYDLVGVGGATTLLITSLNPVNEPVIKTGVEIGCGANISREFTLFLDPPGSLLKGEPSNPPPDQFTAVATPVIAPPSKLPDITADSSANGSKSSRKKKNSLFNPLKKQNSSYNNTVDERLKSVGSLNNDTAFVTSSASNYVDEPRPDGKPVFKVSSMDIPSETTFSGQSVPSFEPNATPNYQELARQLDPSNLNTPTNTPSRDETNLNYRGVGPNTPSGLLENTIDDLSNQAPPGFKPRPQTSNSTSIDTKVTPTVNSSSNERDTLSAPIAIPQGETVSSKKRTKKASRKIASQEQQAEASVTKKSRKHTRKVSKKHKKTATEPSLVQETIVTSAPAAKIKAAADKVKLTVEDRYASTRQDKKSEQRTANTMPDQSLTKDDMAKTNERSTESSSKKKTIPSSPSGISESTKNASVHHTTTQDTKNSANATNAANTPLINLNAASIPTAPMMPIPTTSSANDSTMGVKTFKETAAPTVNLAGLPADTNVDEKAKANAQERIGSQITDIEAEKTKIRKELDALKQPAVETTEVASESISSSIPILAGVGGGLLLLGAIIAMIRRQSSRGMATQPRSANQKKRKVKTPEMTAPSTTTENHADIFGNTTTQSKPSVTGNFDTFDEEADDMPPRRLSFTERLLGMFSKKPQRSVINSDTENTAAAPSGLFNQLANTFRRLRGGNTTMPHDDDELHDAEQAIAAQLSAQQSVQSSISPASTIHANTSYNTPLPQEPSLGLNTSSDSISSYDLFGSPNTTLSNDVMSTDLSSWNHASTTHDTPQPMEPIEPLSVGFSAVMTTESLPPTINDEAFPVAQPDLIAPRTMISDHADLQASLPDWMTTPIDDIVQLAPATLPTHELNEPTAETTQKTTAQTTPAPVVLATTILPSSAELYANDEQNFTTLTMDGLLPAELGSEFMLDSMNISFDDGGLSPLPEQSLPPTPHAVDATPDIKTPETLDLHTPSDPFAPLDFSFNDSTFETTDFAPLDLSAFDATPLISPHSGEPMTASFAEPTHQPTTDEIDFLDDVDLEHDHQPLITDTPEIAELQQLADTLSEVAGWSDKGQDERAINLLRRIVHDVRNLPPLPWLMLFELYKKTNRRAIYEALALRFNRRFGTSAPTWDHLYIDPLLPQQGLDDRPELMEKVWSDWGTPNSLQYLLDILYTCQAEGLPLNTLQQRDILNLLKVAPLTE